MAKEKNKENTSAENKLANIHKILNDYDGNEALEMIREELYGGSESLTPVDPWDDEEKNEP